MWFTSTPPLTQPSGSGSRTTSPATTSLWSPTTARGPVGGSDNASFAMRDIPIIWYHTDGHPDYHQPSDHADRLNWEKVVDITKASFLNVWNLANEETY